MTPSLGALLYILQPTVVMKMQWNFHHMLSVSHAHRVLWLTVLSKYGSQRFLPSHGFLLVFNPLILEIGPCWLPLTMMTQELSFVATIGWVSIYYTKRSDEIYLYDMAQITTRLKE